MRYYVSFIYPRNGGSFSYGYTTVTYNHKIRTLDDILTIRTLVGSNLYSNSKNQGENQPKSTEEIIINGIIKLKNL